MSLATLLGEELWHARLPLDRVHLAPNLLLAGHVLGWVAGEREALGALPPPASAS